MQGGNNIAKKKRKSQSNYMLEERYVPQRQGVGLND
jgi:hypothetical protein